MAHSGSGEHTDHAPGLAPDELESVLQRVGDGVIVRDAELKVRYVNEAARRILGIHDPGEVNPEPLETWDVLDEHGKPAEFPVRDVVTSGISWHGRLFEIRRPGHAPQWLRSASAPIVLADGSTGALSLFTDVTADHEARREAEQREEYYRLIADNATDVMWRSDRDGSLTWISPSVTPILGWQPGELAGRLMVDVVHPDDRSVALRANAAALTGQRASSEVRLQRADGSWCPMGVRAGPFLDSDRHTVGTFATARDITRERLSQHQVEGSERRFRVLADLGERLQVVADANEVAQAAADFVASNVGDGVIVSLLEGEATLRVTAVAHPDGQAEQLLNGLRDLGAIALPATLSAGVVATGRTVLASSPESPEHVDDAIAPYRSEFGGSSIMIVPLTAYGTVIGTMTVTRDEAHVPLGARDRDLLEEIGSRTALAIHDAVLRERAAEAKEALETSERLFRLAMRHSPVGMALVGLDGQWLEVNDALAAITGYEPDELLHLTFQDISHPDDLDADLALFDQLLAGEIPDYRIHKRYMRRDDAPVWIELRVSLVRAATGEPLYVIGQMVDLDATAAGPRPGQREPRDQITGLVQRPALLRSLSMAVTDQRHPGRDVYLCVCDLDAFEKLNARLGRAAGNWVLHETADRISRRLRASDSVARVGPDEFAIVLSTMHFLAEATAVVDQLRDLVAAPVTVPGADPVCVTMCVGMAPAPAGADPETVLAEAVRLLEQAKAQGPDTVATAAPR